LCGCDDEVGQWYSYFCILEAASFDGDIDELEELIGLLGAEFDFDHAAGASATGACSSTAATGVSVLTKTGST
jgi:hypothetical protein